jgi:hypothetical protein
MMVSAPLVRPDEPNPAMALPTINMVEERATPQIMDPNSKRPRKAMNVIWGKLAHQTKKCKVELTLEPKLEYIFPVDG